MDDHTPIRTTHAMMGSLPTCFLKADRLPPELPLPSASTPLDPTEELYLLICLPTIYLSAGMPGLHCRRIEFLLRPEPWKGRGRGKRRSSAQLGTVLGLPPRTLDPQCPVQLELDHVPTVPLRGCLASEAYSRRGNVRQLRAGKWDGGNTPIRTGWDAHGATPSGQCVIWTARPNLPGPQPCSCVSPYPLLNPSFPPPSGLLPSLAGTG